MLNITFDIEYEFIASYSLQKCISPNKIMSGNLCFVMMTSQVAGTFPQERFILLIEKYAINVRNTIFYQMVIDKTDAEY